MLNWLGIIQKDTSDEVILEPRTIAKHYLRGWFIVDLLSSIPVDYVFLVAMAFEEPGDSHVDRFVCDRIESNGSTFLENTYNVL